MNKLILSTMLSLSLSVITIQASEKRGRKNFNAADKNKDEKVSKEEFDKAYAHKIKEEEKREKLWELSDLDKDEHLTFKEWQDGRHALAAHLKGKKKAKDSKKEESKKEESKEAKEG